MGNRKPNMQIRKPPTDNETVAAFIGQGDTRANADVQTSRRPESQTSGSPERRQTTVYFDEEVFKRLKVHCVMGDVEMSATVTEAVRQHLENLEK